jgi:hypothetical protein
MEVAVLAGLTTFIGLLTVGVLRRWRWIFWLVLVAFLAGILRVPAAILQLTGVMDADVPTWYVIFQGVIGLAQVAIGLAMLAGYRRAGVGARSELSRLRRVLERSSAPRRRGWRRRPRPGRRR